jgi:NADPH:quinone reductase
MRAFTLEGFDTQPALRDDFPEPELADDGVLVRVHASSVNGADVLIVSSFLKEMVEHEFPIVLGRDFAGVVERVGSSAGRYRVEDEVFGFVLHANPTVHDGSWAELIALPQDLQVAPKPHHVDFAHAGAAPLAGVSAIATFDALAPAVGETILVVGATGGVGSFFVQLAAAAGAKVIAPALAEDEDYLRDLGVADVLDREGDVAAQVRDVASDGVDAILDVVSQQPEASLLKEGGRLASMVGAAGEGSDRFNLVAEPTPANLERLAGLLDDGTLRVRIQRRYALERAADAIAAFATTHTRGKIGVTFV